MNLTIEQVNDILSNLDKHNLKAKYSLVAENEPKDYYEENIKVKKQIKPKFIN